MAINIRGISKLNNLTKNMVLKSNFINVGLRSLYTERDLGVTAYENTRFVFRNQFITIENTFRNKMKDICEQENTSLYTEDLKAMLHLVQNTDDDVNLLIKMLEKYSETSEESKINGYAFGPVVMRVLYYLNKPQLAFDVFRNEKLSASFHYRSSFRILMCLLLKHNMYKEAREVYENIVNAKGVDFIGRNNILMYNACLKENTPESFEYAITKWKTEYDTIRLSRRCAAMLALLAIRQNHSRDALQILSAINRDQNISVRSLKIMALTHLENYLHIVPILKVALEKHDFGYKQGFFADVIYELVEKLNASDVPEKEEILNAIQMLKNTDCIEINDTLEEYLCRPIQIPHKDKTQLMGMKRYIPRGEQIGLKNYL